MASSLVSSKSPFSGSLGILSVGWVLMIATQCMNEIDASAISHEFPKEKARCAFFAPLGHPLRLRLGRKGSCCPLMEVSKRELLGPITGDEALKFEVSGCCVTMCVSGSKSTTQIRDFRGWFLVDFVLFFPCSDPRNGRSSAEGQTAFQAWKLDGRDASIHECWHGMRFQHARNNPTDFSASAKK